jgi:hypothetical protein
LHPEGLATGQLSQGFPWFSSVLEQMLSWYPNSTLHCIRNTQIHCVGRMLSPYLTGNTLRLHYKAQPVNAVWGNNHCLFSGPYGTHRYSVWAECRVCTSEEILRLRYKAKPVKDVLKTVAVYCENLTEHTDTLCRQNVEIVPQRKHITSPLQRPTA